MNAPAISSLPAKWIIPHFKALSRIRTNGPLRDILKSMGEYVRSLEVVKKPAESGTEESERRRRSSLGSWKQGHACKKNV